MNEVDITVTLNETMYRELETAAFKVEVDLATFARECIETVLAERRRKSRSSRSRLI